MPLVIPEDGAPNVQHQHDGTVRTAMNCHACSHGFLAEIDHALGRGAPHPLIISCPHCGHHHYRVILDGVVTDERHGQGDGVDAFQAKVKTWKHETLPAKASTTSEFLKHRWLNLAQGGR